MEDETEELGTGMECQAYNNCYAGGGLTPASLHSGFRSFKNHVLCLQVPFFDGNALLSSMAVITLA